MPPLAVTKNKRRIEEIKDVIDGKRTGRSKGSSEQQSVKSKLAELRGQFQALVVSEVASKGLPPAAGDAAARQGICRWSCRDAIVAITRQQAA